MPNKNKQQNGFAVKSNFVLKVCETCTYWVKFEKTNKMKCRIKDIFTGKFWGCDLHVPKTKDE